MKKVILTLVAAGTYTLGGTWTMGFANADNGCGWDQAYLCEETDYLRLVARDGIKGDPAALLKAGYAACVVAKPGDENGLIDREAGRAAVLATGIVTSSQDADTIVSEATVDLCN